MARRFLTSRLMSWGVEPDSVDLVLLLSSEAVTNAVVHAGSASVLTLAVSGDKLEVGVHDTSRQRLSGLRPQPAGPVQQPAESKDPLAESGRGMLLIAALSQTWGVQDVADGKQVWFRVAVSRDMGVGSRCGCDDLEVHGVVLGSGARVVHADP